MTAPIAETTDLLRRTPGLLSALLAGLADGWTDTPDVAGGWRPRDVVGHLISAELDDWMPRVRRILDGTDRPFDPFDRFAHVERDAGLPLDELFERFAALRAEALRELDGLVTDADLGRRGRHPALGEVTLAELLATWAVHDLDHVSQVFAGMAGSRDAEVGPWKAYLGILAPARRSGRRPRLTRGRRGPPGSDIIAGWPRPSPTPSPRSTRSSIGTTRPARRRASRTA